MLTGAVFGLDTLRVLASVGAGLAIVLLGVVFFVSGSGVERDVRARLGSYAPAAERGGWRRPLRLLRAVAAGAEEAARRQGLLTGVNSLLEQADLPLRAGEALLAAAAGAIVVGAVVGLVSQSLLLGLLATIIAALAVVAFLQSAASRERRRFEEQLPGTLNLLATSLRAGYSLLQSVEAVAAESAEPTAREFGRALSEIRLGRRTADALRGVAERMGSVDFGWAVMAVDIQRDVGGNLAEVLTTASNTLVQRTRLRREIRALTAEGRISALILSLVPFGLFAFLLTTNPGYLDPLLDETGGRLALIGSALLVGAGILWLRRIVSIEI